MGGRLLDRLRPPEAPPARVWETRIEDPSLGAVCLSGLWSGPSSGGDLLVVVHGLGGCAESFYARRAAAAAEGAGVGCLRLNLRGADERGEDIYHAGLWSDLAAVVESPAFDGYERLLLLGYSLGGHLALGLACDRLPPRVAAVAAVCAPLDLDATSRSFDLRRRWLYRRYILGHLRRAYRAVAGRGRGVLSFDEARSIGHIREWDDRIVAPRFGFDDAADYYRRASVGPRLAGLACPALLVAARHDPFVPAETVVPFAGRAREALRVCWVARAGHVAFPRPLDLGVRGAGPGLESQVLAWLAAAGG